MWHKNVPRSICPYQANRNLSNMRLFVHLSPGPRITTWILCWKIHAGIGTILLFVRQKWGNRPKKKSELRTKKSCNDSKCTSILVAYPSKNGGKAILFVSFFYLMHWDTFRWNFTRLLSFFLLLFLYLCRLLVRLNLLCRNLHTNLFIFNALKRFRNVCSSNSSNCLFGAFFSLTRRYSCRSFWQYIENRVNGFENPSLDSVRSLFASDNNGIPTKRKSKNNKKGNPNNNWKRK